MEDSTEDENFNLDPGNFGDILEEIEISKQHILGLKDNWDGEGSPAFKKDIWNRAVDLLVKISQTIFNETNIIPLKPIILPVADQSIDIRWQTQHARFTINVAEDLEESPCFFGKDTDGNEIEGTIHNEKALAVVLLWLKIMQKDPPTSEFLQKIYPLKTSFS